MAAVVAAMFMPESVKFVVILSNMIEQDQLMAD